MSVRSFLERLGIIDPVPPELDELRALAETANKAGRDEIHASRERRSVLNLEYELAQRKRGNR
jgi:hypothetical protein